MSNLLGRNAEGFFGRFLEKRTCARRTGFIHGIIRRNAVHDVGVLGVLPPNFKERIDRGIKMGGRGSVGDDLINDSPRQAMQTDYLSA